jgi:hypothetical protein
MSTKTKEEIAAIRAALSDARMGTYEAATSVTDAADPRAVELYAWNAQVSAALLVPLHICEVVVRNAVSDALTAVYGPRWPWSVGFEKSFSATRIGYDPRRDLQKVRSFHATVGKVIPELRFVFWQNLFTGRYDARLWNPYLVRVFPNIDTTETVQRVRKRIHDDLGQIRELRNRIAHHEPIFGRNLSSDLQRIQELVELRCRLTSTWMTTTSSLAPVVIAARP